MIVHDFAICRARDPFLGVQCEVVGQHEYHEISGVKMADGSEAKRRWLTCDMPCGPSDRPCLKVRRHEGACEP